MRAEPADRSLDPWSRHGPAEKLHRGGNVPYGLLQELLVFEDQK